MVSVRLTIGDNAGGRSAGGAVRLVVEDAVDAALLVAEARRAEGPAVVAAALAALERAAHVAGVVGAVDAGDTVDASVLP